jgi:hypothetical protein
MSEDPPDERITKANDLFQRAWMLADDLRDLRRRLPPAPAADRHERDPLKVYYILVHLLEDGLRQSSAPRSTVRARPSRPARQPLHCQEMPTSAASRACPASLVTVIVVETVSKTTGSDLDSMSSRLPRPRRDRDGCQFSFAHTAEQGRERRRADDTVELLPVIRHQAHIFQCDIHRDPAPG